MVRASGRNPMDLYEYAAAVELEHELVEVKLLEKLGTNIRAIGTGSSLSIMYTYANRSDEIINQLVEMANLRTKRLKLLLRNVDGKADSLKKWLDPEENNV